MTRRPNDASFPSAGGTGPTYHLKVLVPAVAAGAIIGKGGETIAQLQKDAGARVKMSKASDFYPGLYPVPAIPFLTAAGPQERRNVSASFPGPWTAFCGSTTSLWRR